MELFSIRIQRTFQLVSTLLDKISEIQDYLSNEVSDICSQYYYEAGQLMPEDED